MWRKNVREVSKDPGACWIEQQTPQSENSIP